MPFGATDAGMQHLATIQGPREGRIVATRDIPELATPPLHPHRVLVERVVGFTDQRNAISRAQLEPYRAGLRMAKARQWGILHQHPHAGRPVCGSGRRRCDRRAKEQGQGWGQGNREPGGFRP